MHAIIDTHIFLHMLGEADRLSPTQRSFVEDPNNALSLSIASVWEIVIKYSLGKLRLPTNPEAIFPSQLDALHVALLPVTLQHVLQVRTLPHHHEDPFDRLIIAQTTVERCSIVSSDYRFPLYQVALIN